MPRDGTMPSPEIPVLKDLLWLTGDAVGAAEAYLETARASVRDIVTELETEGLVCRDEEVISLNT